jgi:hypothetical protein
MNDLPLQVLLFQNCMCNIYNTYILHEKRLKMSCQICNNLKYSMDRDNILIARFMMKDLISSASSGCISCRVLNNGIHAFVKDSEGQHSWDILRYTNVLQANLSGSNTILEYFTLQGKLRLCSYQRFYFHFLKLEVFRKV